MEQKSLKRLTFVFALTMFISARSMDYHDFMVHATLKQSEYNDLDRQEAASKDKKNGLYLKSLAYGAGSVGAGLFSASCLVTSFAAHVMNGGRPDSLVGTVFIMSPLLAVTSIYCAYKSLSTGIKGYQTTPQNVFNDEKMELIKQIRNFKKISYEDNLDLQLTSVLRH